MMSPVNTKLTPAEAEAVEQLRSRLAPRGTLEEWKLSSDNFMLRYLKANRFNLDKAEQMIDDYVTFLRDYNFDQLVKETFPQDFANKFSSYNGGWDKEGRPIAVIPHGGQWNVKEAINNGEEEMFIHYVFKLTAKLEKDVIEKDSDYGIIVMDVSNLAYGNYFHKRTLEVLLFLVRKIEKVAPGLIGKLYLVNAGKLTVALFNTIKRMVTLSTDVYFMDSDEDKWKACLREFIPEEGICPHFGGVCKTLVKV